MYEEKIHDHNTVGDYHCFIIEQYFNEEACSVNYRIYQAWQNKYDLNEYFSKANHCLDSNQFRGFLTNLKSATRSRQTSVSNLEEFKQACQKFAQAENECSMVSERRLLPSALYFNHIMQTISGLSMRYLSTKISPVEHKQNILSALAEMIDD